MTARAFTPELILDRQSQERDIPPEDASIDRTGAWIPVGIVVLVMGFLLLCAALVLVASRQ